MALDDKNLNLNINTISKQPPTKYLEPEIITTSPETSNLLVFNSSLSIEEAASSNIDSKNENSSKENERYYEEVVIHGMSPSPDGFCVILRGLICDR